MEPAVIAWINGTEIADICIGKYSISKYYLSEIIWIIWRHFSYLQSINMIRFWVKKDMDSQEVEKAEEGVE